MLWTVLLGAEFDVFLATLDVACAHMDSVRAAHVAHVLEKRAKRVPIAEESDDYTD